MEFLAFVGGVVMGGIAGVIVGARLGYAKLRGRLLEIGDLPERVRKELGG